jgi:AraC-like DNA-binding protein
METAKSAITDHMFRARYREYQPCPLLRPYVRALFTFAQDFSHDAEPARVNREIVTAAGESSWSAMFADSGVSVVFCFGEGYRIDGLWSPVRPSPHVIGPMTAFRTSFPGVRLLQVGAYLLPETASFFLGVPGREIADRVVGLESLWTEARRIDEELADCEIDSHRVAVVEAALIRHLKPHRIPVIEDAARMMRESGGQMAVGSIAESIGISRQLLGRKFREQIGLSPKLYLRLHRFRKTLASLGSESCLADAAAAAGYFDQSHMIKEFREFCGMAPAAIVRQRPFHPFTGLANRSKALNEIATRRGCRWINQRPQFERSVPVKPKRY